jgi:hypothetical protein
MSDFATAGLTLALTISTPPSVPEPTVPIPDRFRGVWAEVYSDGRVASCLNRSGGVLTITSSHLGGTARSIGRLNIINRDEDLIIVQLVERRGRANSYYDMGLKLTVHGRRLRTHHVSLMKLTSYVRCP